MKLRTKFLCFAEGFILLGVVSLSVLLHRLASRELTSAARQQLEQSVAIIATQISFQFSCLTRDVDLWAQLPLSIATARDPRDPAQAAAFSRFFSGVRETFGIFHSIKLVNPDAECVATGNPEEERLDHPGHRATVAGRDDFRTALKGTTTLSEPLVLCDAGRPCLAVSAPIRVGESVLGVLRVVVDLELFNRKWLAPLSVGRGSRVAVLAAETDLKLIATRLAGEPFSGDSFEPSDMPIPTPMPSDASGFFEYPAQDDWRIVAYRRLEQPGWVLVAERPMDEVLAPITRLERVAIGSALGAALFLGVGIFLTVRPAIRDLRECQQFAHDIRDGHLDRRLAIRRRDEVGGLACSLNDMAAGIARQHRELEQAERKYRAIFEKAVEGKRLLAESRWETMRYQVNPHFLFNVLNTLDDLSRQAPERIPPMNLALARYLRLTLDPGEGHLFPLNRELDAVAAYLEIEEVRFADRLRVAWEIDPGARDFPTPELVLQPLVENAVKFGMRTAEGPLRIRVRARVEAERLTLTVENSGCWVPPDADRERPSVGLDNLRRRLEARYDGDFEMRAGSFPGGVRVWLRLPKAAAPEGRTETGCPGGVVGETGGSFRGENSA